MVSLKFRSAREQRGILVTLPVFLALNLVSIDMLASVVAMPVVFVLIRLTSSTVNI